MKKLLFLLVCALLLLLASAAAPALAAFPVDFEPGVASSTRGVTRGTGRRSCGRR